MIHIGYMRLSQRGPLMTRDDVMENRTLAHEIFGTRDVEFEEPRNMLLWATLFYYAHIVEVYAPEKAG
jgi:hypothetical protein